MATADGHTVAASSIVGLLAYARGRGIASDGVLASVGVTAASLEGPEARVSHAANNAIWAGLAAASGDADFGLHVAEQMTVDAFGVVGHLVSRSLTFGQALERVVAYSRILHDAGRVELERRASALVVYPGCRGLTHDFPRHVAEFSAASVLVLARMVTRTKLQATAVRFRHPAPSRTTEHARVFGVAPVFDQPETEVELSPAAYDLAIPAAEPGVLTYLDAYARDVLAKLPDDAGLVSAVERAIATAMSTGVPAIEAVAAQLAVSPRTLQRRLDEAETSYQMLVDHVRRRYAERYLSDHRLSIAEVSFLVGFAEPSNLHRAFKRWTGETPAAFREHRRGPDAG